MSLKKDKIMKKYLKKKSNNLDKTLKNNQRRQYIDVNIKIVIQCFLNCMH